jgi:hypothetical protein
LGLVAWDWRVCVIDCHWSFRGGPSRKPPARGPLFCAAGVGVVRFPGRVRAIVFRACCGCAKFVLNHSWGGVWGVDASGDPGTVTGGWPEDRFLITRSRTGGEIGLGVGSRVAGRVVASPPVEGFGTRVGRNGSVRGSSVRAALCAAAGRGRARRGARR